MEEEKKDISLSDYVKKNHASYTTYQGIPINGSNLYHLSEKMPKSLEKSVSAWATKNKNFLQVAIPLNKEFDLKDRPSKQSLQEFSELISLYGFENKSTENVVIPVFFENENWFIKFAGPLRRWLTLNSTAFCCNKEQPIENLITYQTPSRAAYNLHYKKLFEQEKIEHVELPPIYLGHIPGRLPLEKSVSDENCFTIEKEIKGFIRLRNDIDYLHQTPEAAINNLVTLMIKGPLFDLEHNLAFDTYTKKLVIADLEQSCGESGYFFFQKNEETIKKKISQSILGFLSLLEKGAQTYRAQDTQRIYTIFCKELKKYPMIEKFDGLIELKRLDVEEAFNEVALLKNKSLKSE